MQVALSQVTATAVWQGLIRKRWHSRLTQLTPTNKAWCRLLKVTTLPPTELGPQACVAGAQSLAAVDSVCVGPAVLAASMEELWKSWSRRQLVAATAVALVGSIVSW